MTDESEIKRLREEVRELLAALQKESNHAAEMHRRDELHIAEMQRRDDTHVAESQRRDELHVAELARRDQFHIEEMGLLTTALESRDTIGQAKGIIIATMSCTSLEAFQLLKDQSQHENRKLVEIAAEIVERAQRTHRHD